MRQAALIGGLIALLAIAGSVVLLTTSGTDKGPSSSEQAVCASMQDWFDDVRADAGLPTLEADLRRAGMAANRGDNVDLASQVRKMRIALGKYADSYETQADWEKFIERFKPIDATCKGLGLPVRV